MNLILVLLGAIVYAAAGLLLCLWVDGIATAATERYIGSSGLRSLLAWILWPLSLPLLVLSARWLQRRERGMRYRLG